MLDRCPITNTIMETERRFLLCLTWDPIEVHKFCFMHPYKEEKETPLNFHVGICDRAPRLTYVGGPEVVCRNFIFPSCVHILHLGAKMHRADGNILNIHFKVHVYSQNIFTYLLCVLAFGVKA